MTCLVEVQPKYVEKNRLGDENYLKKYENKQKKKKKN